MYLRCSLHYKQWLTIVFVSFFFTCLFVAIVCAAEKTQALKDRAKQYYWGKGVKQNYSKALEFYLKAAKRGDAESQFISGGMYYRGMGVKENFPAAFKLLHQAAVNGKSNPDSERIIAQAFIQGIGTYKNYKEAVHWYQQSADHGDSEAQNTLGYMYYTGNGVEQDFSKGADFFLQAANNNSAMAQYNVGIMYFTGKGVADIDYVKSYSWMNLAATNGHQPAVTARDYIETIISREELMEAQKYTAEISSSR